ncbi:MAG: DUF1700 domain-containing protein [Eubacteriales bacterium]
MNKQLFMNELETLLRDVPESEKEEAIQYYQDYFEDAGEECEAVVLEELGTPEEVASQIKTTLYESGESYEYGEQGIQNGTIQNDTRVRIVKNGEHHQDTKEKGSNTLVNIMLIVLAIFTFPVWFSVVASGVAVIFSVIIALLSIVLATILLVITGVLLCIAGIPALFTRPLAGFTMIGVGLFMTGIFLFALIGMIWIVKYAIPAMIRGIVWLCKKPIHWIKRRER